MAAGRRGRGGHRNAASHVAVLGPLVVGGDLAVGRPSLSTLIVAVADLTTVADDEIVVHEGVRVIRRDGLDPGTVHEVGGIEARTLDRPEGGRLATVATVNDVHFGEVECGLVEGMDVGPVLRAEPGERAYPDIMNEAAVGEIQALDPDAVIAKGDLTTHGTVEEYEAFLAAYAPFGDRLHHVRGNHDAYHGGTFAADAPFAVHIEGVTMAVLDTTVPGLASGQVGAVALEWLDDLAAGVDRPVLVFGHHHVWDPASSARPDGYFGIHPDDSERLVALVARRRAIKAYFAGHTHRNRVRRFAASGDVPWVEVACVKDFPGAWAEYRVFEGGVVQVHRRISRADALAWSERCRAMFAGTYPSYAFGRLEDRCFTLRW